MTATHDTRITAEFKSLEYQQYSKYPRVQIVADGRDPITGKIKTYKSEVIRNILPKNYSETFTVYIDSKNPENYTVDLTEIKKYQFRHDIFWFVGVPWSVALIGWIASLFLHTK